MSKPMKVFYDSEFLEQSGHIDVISMGFVREDGKELYFVLNSFDTLAVARNEWLMKNVMTSIGYVEYTSHVTGTGQPVKDLLITDTNAMTPVQARLKLMAFTEDIEPEWWAWYGAYDHVALCSLFGRMIDLPDHWPMLTLDLKQMHKAAGSPEMPKQPAGKHNALEDARFNVIRHKFLEQVTPRYFVFAETLAEASRWCAKNRINPMRAFIFKSDEADRIRGLQIRVNDVVVPLAPLSDEMNANLDLARRIS